MELNAQSFCMSIIISAVVSGDMLASCGHAYGVAVGTCSP